MPRRPRVVKPTSNINKSLAAHLLHYRKNPVDFIREVIGVEPTDQQIKLIEAIAKPNARVAVKSATATGKSAVLAWMTLWFLITHVDVAGIITAPTAHQLHRVLRSEISKWLHRMKEPFRSMYELHSKTIFVKGPKKDTQKFSFVTGTKENKETFAGLHGEKCVVFVDEASALNKEIFDTLLGTLSYGDTCFALVSNPVRASGAFYQLFQKKPERWDLLTFTSFDSPNVDKEWIQEVKEYYGEDSDFYQMRVLGEFPVLDSSQFYPTNLIQDAIERTILNPSELAPHPVVFGVDVARFGDDSSVICIRQGPKIHEMVELKGLDTTELSKMVLSLAQQWRPQAIFVDGIGVGSGVVDQLKRFNQPVVDVIVSAASNEPLTYGNLRAELHGKTKHWLSTADIPGGGRLEEDLLNVNFTYNNRLQILIESKKDIKRRGLPSTDFLDSLTLTMHQQEYKILPKKKVLPVVRAEYLWS